jgi:hypothetical protein
MRISYRRSKLMIGNKLIKYNFGDRKRERGKLNMWAYYLEV